MRRGSRLATCLSVLCVVAASCTHATSERRTGSSAARRSEPRIALSVLASAIYLVDSSTGAMTTAVDGLADFQAGFATWAPDHRRLAYGDNGILILDAADASGTVLVNGPSLSMPTWAPDGRDIAYGDGRNLWTTPIDHLHATYLRLPLTVAPLDMSWGPGRVIALEGLSLACHVPYGCTSTGRSDVYTVNANGTGLHRLTRLGDAEAPKWSPDGSELLFVRRPAPSAAGGDLWTVDVDGSRAHAIVRGRSVLAADWSPDGSALAIVTAGSKPKTVQLWRANADGSNLRPLGAAVTGTDASVDW